MSQQPDKFFRDKLRHYQKPVSPGAWQRVSQQVNKSHNGKLWLKVAAAVLVLALAAVFVFTIDIKEREMIATSVGSAEKETPTAPDKSVNENPGTEKAEEKGAAQATVQQKADMPERVEKKSLRPVRAVVAPVEPITPVENSQKSEYPVTQITSVPAVTDTESKSKRVTIMFSAKEVNEKYLTKKEGSEATSEEKESSTLKKVLDKAYDLTHNQDPMGELRQKKNEILAMNFKNEKQRDENN